MQIKNLFKSRLKLEPGTRVTSFLFIATSIAIAAGILIAANMYYNIDTGEVVVEEIQRVARLLKATAGLVVGGTESTTLPSEVALEIATTSAVRLSGAGQELRFTGGTTYYVGIRATTTLTQTTVYTLPPSYPEGSGYVLTSDTSGNLSWVAAGTGGIGDITQVGDCASGDCFTGAQENYTLTFKRGTVYGYLTLDSGGSNATYTLPAVSAGTYYFALTSGTLTSGRVPIVTGAYTIGDSADLTFDTGSRILTIGSSGNAGQLRIYSNNAQYVGFAAQSSLDFTVTYYWPPAPATAGQVLSSDASGNLYWLDLGAAGYGDILTVGDCASGDCFTVGGATSTTLWFRSGSYYGALTVQSGFTGNATFTLPAVSPGSYYFALATTTYSAGYVAYWSSPNVLTGEQYLSVSRGGTGRGSWTQWGVLYADGSTSLTNTGAGATYQILTANTNGAPSWRNISDLITVSNGLTGEGTTQLTIRLGGTLSQNTEINLGNYNLTFTLGSGDFIVYANATNTLVVNSDGTVYYRQYPLGAVGKEVLREMVPIFGFDLPVKTTTTTAVKISRDIVNYPLNPCEAGTQRVHKLVVRYGSTGTSTIAIATSGGEQASTTLANTGNSAKGTVATAELSIPTPSGVCQNWNQGDETDDWWVTIRLNQSDTEIMIYQIFLAGYDKIL